MKCTSITIRGVRVPRRLVRRLVTRRPIRATRCQADVPSLTDNGLVKVKFTIPHHVEFGQSVCVMGSAAELGDWQVEKSHCLGWNEGDIWSGVVELPPTEVEYKYFTKNPDGTAAEWQPCANLTAMIPEGDEMEVVDEWGGDIQLTETEISTETEPTTTSEVPESVSNVVSAVEEEKEEETTKEEIFLGVVDEAKEIPESVQELAEEVVGGDVLSGAVSKNSNTSKEETLSA